MQQSQREERSESPSYSSRGKRYSPAQRQEILTYAQTHSVRKASGKYQVTDATIYEWRRKQERRNPKGPQEETDQQFQEEVLENLQARRDEKILSMWRQHPGFGPSQIRNMLKRAGFKVSVGTVRHVMEEGGYLPPKLKAKERARRYEAARPKELYHLDFYHFYVHKQKQCLLFIEDDFSRFICGWSLVSSENSEAVLSCFEKTLQRYGRPEGVMSDRGSAFHSWKGISRFESFLEESEINFYLAREASVNGKVEALNASFQKECVHQMEFMDLTDAVRGIGRWVDHYNHQRTHHGLGGLLVPSDRFYGLAEENLRRIEQGLGASNPSLTSLDSRGLELFRVVSRGGQPEVWLMGQKILG
jgi:putative transposase